MESALKHGDQIQIGDFVIQFFIGVPFARPQAGAKPVSPAKAVQKETVAKAPVQKAPISSSGPVAGSGLVSVDQKKPVEHASLSNVPVSGPDQPEELVVDENPIPLFAHVSEEEDISSPVKDGALAPVPSSAQQGSAPPSVPSSAQQGSAVSPPVSATVKDSLSLSGALSKADDSTAPVLQKIEETYPEPILHPEPVKQSRKPTPAPETAKAEQAPQVESAPSVEPVKPAPRAEPVLQAEPAKPAPRAEPVLQAEPAKPAPRAEPARKLSQLSQLQGQSQSCKRNQLSLCQPLYQMNQWGPQQSFCSRSLCLLSLLLSRHHKGPLQLHLYQKRLNSQLQT